MRTTDVCQSYLYCVEQDWQQENLPASTAINPDTDDDIDTTVDGNEEIASLWNHTTGKPISSGDCIVMKPEDPNTHPLPKWDIMKMQWCLQKAAAIDGTADVYDDNDDDDDNFREDEDDARTGEEFRSSAPTSVSSPKATTVIGANASLDIIGEPSTDLLGQRGMKLASNQDIPPGASGDPAPERCENAPTGDTLMTGVRAD
ncbi:hypothetical protein UA08_03564 [Talaromyces atroroseus]|uniref:Uncharacterized protein n=1 Tax=Talaromyces atroroseus TaxID=1441469 RepID=A0A225ARC1_TALAT|nr:hypothetical protein UA08_03564 [Talaromyces atroroseus]OKL60914.1 hypothetical protein UA08_03564 [Talaromyces atroroseus]